MAGRFRGCKKPRRTDSYAPCNLYVPVERKHRAEPSDGDDVGPQRQASLRRHGQRNPHRLGDAEDRFTAAPVQAHAAPSPERRVRCPQTAAAKEATRPRSEPLRSNCQGKPPETFIVTQAKRNWGGSENALKGSSNSTSFTKLNGLIG